MKLDNRKPDDYVVNSDLRWIYLSVIFHYIIFKMNNYNIMGHLFFSLLFTLPLLTYSQTQQNIYTHDIDNFWVAYDSIRSTSHKEEQINFINKLYIEKASEGLKAFLKNKAKIDSKWVDLINREQSFWGSIRPRTLVVKALVNGVQHSIDSLRTLYPTLKNAATYFIIGIRQQGGTIRNNLSIIGTEVIMSQPNFAEVERICIHEYVHTQQVRPDFQKIDVLTSSIREGACDFISELVLKQNLSLPYIQYGLENEVKVWQVFAQDMLTSANDLWVSTGSNPVLPSRDLGYYVGYAICKSYYNTAKNKSQAIKDIIDLDYANPNAVTDFLKKSNYENYIISKGYDPARKLNKEGYISTPSSIVFSFSALEKTVIKDEDGSLKVFDTKTDTIKSVSIAGDFNDWDHKNSTFQLTKTQKGKYILKVDRNKLGKAGAQIRFKFVINNKYLVEPKFAIINRITDKQTGTNLFVQL